MFSYLSSLRPATIRSWATFLEQRTKPTTEETESIARELGANPAAVLALARGEFRDLETGRIIDLENICSEATIPEDWELLAAILARSGPTGPWAKLWTTWGVPMKRQYMTMWADDWARDAKKMNRTAMESAR